MKKVLIISYYWPPAGGPGVQRILKFSKFLPENGWMPIVIAPKNGTYPAIDESMLNDIPKECLVIRTKTLEPFAIYNMLKGSKGEVPVGTTGLQNKSRIQKLSNYVRANYFIPDARKFWKGYVINAAKKVLKEHKIEAIITTGPPHSTHLAGLTLKEKYQIPWIADFRDPWTNIFYNNFLPRTEKTENKDLKLENSVVQGCSHLVVATPGLEREFSDRKKEITTILNGFDQEDISAASNSKTDKFTLAYVGNLLPSQSVNALWEAIEELVTENVFTAENFLLKITGKADNNILERLKNGAAKEILEVEGYLPHKEATRRMQEASLLLFIIPKDKNNKLILTGKLFEYLATRKPILGIGPVEGDADTILQNSGRDPIIEFNEKQQIKTQLLRYFEIWKSNDQTAFQYAANDALLQFSRQHQAKQLADVLATITEQ
ncbi:MAG: glycosyltransferase family 4 protein [Crocinitomicaceae bacterium]